MKITIEPKDRIELLKYVNMYKLATLLEFEQPNRGGWYCDYSLKEHLPKEKTDERKTN